MGVIRVGAIRVGPIRISPPACGHAHDIRRGAIGLCDFRCDFWALGRWRTCAPPSRVPIETPLGRAAWPPVAGMESGRFARHCRVAPFSGVKGATAGARVGGSRDKKGIANVATMSSAEPTRRDFLYIATGAVAAFGAAATLVPLVAQMNPDASTIAAGVPVDVDLSPIVAGQVITVFWRSQPIFISHRTQKEIDEARAVDTNSLIDPATDQSRVKAGHDQWLVLIGICTHLGCIPIAHL